MAKYILQLVIAVTIIGLFHAFPAWSKPKPVEGTFQMFNAFNKLEGEMRAEKWHEAKKTILYIQTYYSRLSQELKKSIEEKIVSRFGFLIIKLRVEVEHEEAEAAENYYMSLQEHFITIMNYYDYPVPPIFTIYDRYIHEAVEGLEQGNFHETAEEMEEILELRDLGIEAFQNTGTSSSDIDIFFATLESVKKSAKEKNLVEAQKGLRELEGLMKQYLNAPID